jgi:hypothetical protein
MQRHRWISSSVTPLLLQAHLRALSGRLVGLERDLQELLLLLLLGDLLCYWFEPGCLGQYRFTGAGE